MSPKIENSAFLINFFLLIILIAAEDERIPKKLSTLKICASENSCNSLSLKSLPSQDLDQLLFIFSSWTKWTPCNSNCAKHRSRFCRFPIICGTTVVNEEAFCYQRRSYCEYVYHKNWNELNSNDNDDVYEDEVSGETFQNLFLNTNPVSNFHAFMNKGQARDYANPISHVLKRNYNDYDSNSRRDQYHQRNNGPIQNYYENSRLPNTRQPNYGPIQSSRNPECGIPKLSDINPTGRTLRILGGREVEKGRWPWQAAIHNRDGQTFCGGTLIAPQWVLTAAHCIKRRISVTIGEHHLHNIDGTEKHFQVDTAFIHPNFDIDTVDNDIALILLPEPVKSDYTMACLPQQNQSLPVIGSYCTILGWGKERYNHVFGTSVLHEGQVPIVSNALCRKTHGYSDISPNMFCGGFRNGTVDSCQGDSGGPLLCSHQNRWTIFGVTSFGDGCGVRGKYGIYAKVPNYIDWIHRVMEAQRNPIHNYYY